MNTEGKYIANKRVKHPYSWAKTTVYQILSNPVYLGKLVSQRYTTRSFKDNRIVERPPEEWVIVENTHEPLVDQATFDTVQERIKIKQPATWTNTDNMFRGLMICGGCNTRMVFTTRKKIANRKVTSAAIRTGVTAEKSVLRIASRWSR
jgi:site-specific DNA recombinase